MPVFFALFFIFDFSSSTDEKEHPYRSQTYHHFFLKNLKLKVQISSCNSFSRNVLQTYFKKILELPWNLKHLKGFKNWPCRF